MGDVLGDNGKHLLRAMLLQCRRRLIQRSARIRHVVHQNRNLVLDLSHQNHTPHDVGPRPLLVDEREGHVEAVGHGRGALGAAGVGGDDDERRDVEVLRDPLEDRGLGVEVVDGDAEEALDLRGVEVDGYDVVLLGGLDYCSTPALCLQLSADFARGKRWGEGGCLTHPELCSMLATRRAEMGARLLSFLSWRA